MNNSSTSIPINQAFQHAIRPNGPVAQVFAAELVQALPWMPKDAAIRSVNDTVMRRSSELGKPTPLHPPVLDEYGLPEGKRQELVHMLAQPGQGDVGKSADALIHIYANVQAQRELHEALAEKVFVRGGAFERALTQGLQDAAPELTPAQAWQEAATFVDVRRARAQAVVKALAAGGVVEREAVQRAEKLRRAEEQAPASATKHSVRDPLGEDIAFGLQQTLACWGTDFIDPYVGKWFQDKFKDHHHSSTHAHTWGGEIIGDSAAFFAFLGVRKFAPNVVEAIKGTVRATGDGMLEKFGRRSLRAWAQENAITQESDEYKAQMEQWKEFQAENIAKSSVITGSSVVLNVATQKAMGNSHTLAVITASKVVGAAITMATMLGLRYFVPKTTKQLDDELNERYFTPVIRKTQTMFGAEQVDVAAEPKGTYTKRLQAEEVRPQNAPALRPF